MFLKLALIFIIWGIYGDLEKKNDETSSFCMGVPGMALIQSEIN